MAELSGKFAAFLENAALLNRKFGLHPLLYGSLGLGMELDEDLHPDDIDMLIPEEFLHENGRWDEFRAALEEAGYELIDLHEHTFLYGGEHFAYAGLENLEEFAGIAVDGIRDNGIYRTLTLADYEKVYTASQKDGYRQKKKNNADAEKVARIRKKFH